MKKIFTFTAITVFITLGCFKPNSVNANDNNGINLVNSLVWEITGPDLKQPSYLAGTIHLMCEQDFNIDARLKQAIEETERVFLEIDMDDPAEISKLMSGMVAKTPLKERMSTTHYKQLEEIISQYTTYNISLFDKTEFFGIVSMLTMATMNCPIKTLDTELMSLAQASTKPVFGLEKVADQLAVMSTMNPDTNDNEPWTEEELAGLGLMKETMEKMISIYQSEDINEMYKMTSEMLMEADNGDAILTAMLDTRNIKWVEQIPALTKQSPTLFAVGAAHLGGEKGVINLLREAGLTVKAVLK